MTPALYIAILLAGQNPEASFDAASVKTAAPQTGGGRISRSLGGPGSTDPGRLRLVSFSMKALIGRAWNLREDQIRGPEWLDTATYDIQATMSPKATAEDLRTMLQNLLRERFGLKVHTQTKLVSGYELKVSTSGPHLDQPDLSHKGLPNGGLPTGKVQALHFPAAARLGGLQITVDSFAAALSKELKVPVTDRTGIAGAHDIVLIFAADSDGAKSDNVQPGDSPGITAPSDEPGLFAALKQQLGLVLEKAKVENVMLVVDSVNRVPAEQ